MRPGRGPAAARGRRRRRSRPPSRASPRCAPSPAAPGRPAAWSAAAANPRGPWPSPGARRPTARRRAGTGAGPAGSASWGRRNGRTERPGSWLRAQGAAVRPLDADGGAVLLGEAGVLDDEDAFGTGKGFRPAGVGAAGAHPEFGLGSGAEAGACCLSRPHWPGQHKFGPQT